MLTANPSANTVLMGAPTPFARHATDFALCYLATFTLLDFLAPSDIPGGCVPRIWTR